MITPIGLRVTVLKALEATWAEAYPYTLRWDWADEMLYWFDWYLRGEGRAPTLGVEMQDNRGGWRFESTYPLQIQNICKSVALIWHQMALLCLPHPQSL